MSKLIFSKASIVDSGGSNLDPAKEIYGVVVDSVEIAKEPTTVAIEDGRELYESYAGSVTFRTVNTQFGQANDGGDILSSLTTHISSNGSVAANKAGIKLHGSGSSPSVVIFPAYVMGHRDFANGRVETVISATAESVNESIVGRAS